MQSNIDFSDKSIISIRTRAASSPKFGNSKQDVTIKQQISAPCYFESLKENESPPFKLPKRKERPKILVGTIMNENEAVEMIAAIESDALCGLKKFMGNLLVKKNLVENYNLKEKQFLISLIREVIDYSAQRDFSAFKLACMCTIYLNCHQFFKGYYWLHPADLWSYFKEIIIRHTIEDSPDGEEVFEAFESYDIITHFHAIYFSNLPLVHITCFGAYRLKLTWPFTIK